MKKLVSLVVFLFIFLINPCYSAGVGYIGAPTRHHAVGYRTTNYRPIVNTYHGGSGFVSAPGSHTHAGSGFVGTPGASLTYGAHATVRSVSNYPKPIRYGSNRVGINNQLTTPTKTMTSSKTISSTQKTMQPIRYSAKLTPNSKKIVRM